MLLRQRVGTFRHYGRHGHVLPARLVASGGGRSDQIGK